MKKIIIIGDGETAELACEYFTYDSPFDVVGFAVERAYRKKNTLFDLPVVDFEEIHERYPAQEFGAFVAISYTQLNRVRARLYQETKEKGYQFVSYVSSRAFVWRNVEMGENCFIMENNVLQYGVRVGNNVVLWSGNHIGHQTLIKDNVFISSHVVVSGYCEIGTNCFLGVNSAIANNIKIADDCVIGMGAVVNRDTAAGKVYAGNPAQPLTKDAYTTFDVRDPQTI